MDNIPIWLIKDIQKILKSYGMKPLPRRKFGEIIPAIHEALERLLISGKIAKDAGTQPITEFLKSLSPEEYKLVLSEAAKIVHGETAYDTRNKSIAEIFRHMHRLTGGLVVYEIGASMGSWMEGILYRSGIRPRLLYQTNFGEIPREMLDTLDYNPVYKTGVNILDKDITSKIPGKAHIVVVKDVMKFIRRWKRRNAFKNVSKLVQEGGILIIGSSMVTERDREITSRMPYVIDGSSKLSIFLKKNGKMVKVDPNKFMQTLRESRTWEDYFKRLNNIKELKARVSPLDRLKNWRRKTKNKRMIRKAFG